MLAFVATDRFAQLQILILTEGSVFFAELSLLLYDWYHIFDVKKP